MVGCCKLGWQCQREFDTGATANGGADAQTSSNAIDARLYDAQPNASAALAAIALKAKSVISDAHYQLISAAGKDNGHALGTAVTNHVLGRLLHNAEDLQGLLYIELGLTMVMLEF